MRALLFLDFDGVLNRITDTGYVPPHPGLDRDCVARVNTLVERMALTVVISSSWRENYGREEFQAFLRAAGGDRIAHELFAVTPIYEKVPKQQHVRHAEVADWLKLNAPDTPYLILDDSKKFAFPADRFLRIDGKLGFSDADFGRALDILMKQGVQPA